MGENARHRILAACYKLMLPVARALLTNGISYLEFDEMCRQAFVQTASREFGVRRRETNTSRIAAMTGLPRKQVHEIKKNLQSGDLESSDRLSPLADLLQRWATSVDYQDHNGQPVMLKTQDDGTNSFARLVRTCMGDVPPGAVKAELLRLGAISVSADDLLNLKRRSLIPEDVGTRLESAIVYSLRGLANTIAHNCDPNIGESDRLFERFVESPSMSDSDASRFKTLLRSRLTEITEELDSLLAADARTDEADRNRRVGIGLYYTE
ncbi:MAG TPA: DUF6502 family protein [Gammaproteobacteria bacterium]|nr:DUF6502 family protein [Gammaproteobacteria bacterium]